MVFEAAPYRFPHRSLGDVVRSDGPFRPDQAAAVGRQVLAALRQAYAVGVLHRDVKPASVLLGAGNRVMLADFGLATADFSPALTTPQALTGSQRYMAPERARGEPAAPAADLWSLGAVLYAAVEGRAPFDRESAPAVLAAVMAGHPDPPQHAGPLWPVISGLLRTDPQARPDPDGVDWLLQRVAGEPSAARLAAPSGTTLEPASAATTSGRDPGMRQAGLPVPAATPRPRVAARDEAGAGDRAVGGNEAVRGDTGSPVGFVPGFGPRDRRAAAAQRRPRDSPRRWRITIASGGTVAAAGVAAIALAIWPGPGRTSGHSLAVAPAHRVSAPARPSAGPGRRETAAVQNASGAHQGVRPGPAVPRPVRPVPAAGAGYRGGALPAGFSWYRDPTGFSIGVPDHWQVAHQGHLVYLRDPRGSRFLIVDQTSHPKPSPLADWRQQEAARMGSYPGYHRIRLRAVRYAQARRAADWEFTYYDNGQLTRVLNRNILASAHHAYALYWSTPARAWRASYRYFRAFAATFRPAPASQRG
jgi:hypothetical protein